MAVQAIGQACITHCFMHFGEIACMLGELGKQGMARRECALLRVLAGPSTVSWLTRSCFYLWPFAREPSKRDQLSRYCQKYSMLTDNYQARILLAWTRKNRQPCGSPRKICKRLHIFGNYTGVSLIRRRYGWPCNLWQGRSRPHPSHPNKERLFIPRMNDGGFQARCSSKQVQSPSGRKIACWCL